MSELLKLKPFGPRADDILISELNELVGYHLSGCPAYSSIIGRYHPIKQIEDLPFIHVGLFKHMDLRTTVTGVKHGRILHSSSTSGINSKIVLDDKSSALQADSSKKILGDFIGDDARPLLVLDSLKSLIQRGAMSARIAASMSLKPLSSEIHFLLKQTDDPESMKWEVLMEVLRKNDAILVYGFSWILWLAWGKQELPKDVIKALEGKKITFIHSGGWKKLTNIKVDHDQFDSGLLKNLHPDSRVVDYYGLVEQVGVVYPMCESGYRHPPVWADVLVRDSFTLEPVVNRAGQLQLINGLAWGAPYHSVYTEDIAVIIPGECACSRSGKRFKLLGRMPKSEVRGCANV